MYHAYYNTDQTDIEGRVLTGTTFPIKSLTDGTVWGHYSDPSAICVAFLFFNLFLDSFPVHQCILGQSINLYIFMLHLWNTSHVAMKTPAVI